MVQPTDAAAFESANLINAPKPRCLLLVLPLMDTVDKHFMLAWEGATKQTGFVWDDNLAPSQKGIKGVSFQTTGLQILCHRPPETHRKGPMAHGKSGSWFEHSLSSQLIQALWGWDTKVDDWMDANGKMLGMINQSVFFNAACTKILSDIMPDPDISHEFD